MINFNPGLFQPCLFLGVAVTNFYEVQGGKDEKKNIFFFYINYIKQQKFPPISSNKTNGVVFKKNNFQLKNKKREKKLFIPNYLSNSSSLTPKPLLPNKFSSKLNLYFLYFFLFNLKSAYN